MDKLDEYIHHCPCCDENPLKLKQRIQELESQLNLQRTRTSELASKWKHTSIKNKELKAQLATKECVWTKSQIGLGLSWDEYDSWSTSCGEDFAIIEEWHEKPTPYCSNCGGKTRAAIKGEG